jgi:crossover junction endonuclease MUS81
MYLYISESCEAAMELHIDNRERELIRELISDHSFDTFNTKLSNLELGDIVIKYNGKTFAIFERKTLSDLAASIKDSRYKNQKNRLLENYDVKQIYYIIEGGLDYAESAQADVKINGISKNTLLSCIYNMAFRDHIQVFRTSGINETIALIQGVFKRVSENPEKYGAGAAECNTGECAEGEREINEDAAAECNTGERDEQIIKKQVSTPEEFFIRMLYQIPGVSLKTGKAIADKYKTLFSLYDSLSKHSDAEKLKTLKDIFIKDSKGKERRISETVAKNIIKFILAAI